LSAFGQIREPNILPGEIIDTGPFVPVFTDDELDTFITEYMEEHHIPSFSGAIVKDNTVIWQKAYGTAKFEPYTPAADSILYMLASISKTPVSVAVMQLWEQGYFELDDNVSDYLPWEVVHPEYPESPITFRMILTHTSGIKDNWIVMTMLYSIGDSPIPLGEYLEEYLVPGGRYYYPNINFSNWEPGTGYSYSNEAVSLAAYLVEAISGMPFDEYCNENIFQPLGMDETAWFLADLDTNNIAMPYGWSGHEYEPYGYYGYPDYPSGQLRTSAPQLLDFLSMFMNGGELNGVRILESATVDSMKERQYIGIASGQGLIWYYLTLGDRQLLGHGGGDAGVSTEMYFCEAENTGVTALSNGDSYFYDVLNELFEYAAGYNAVEDYTRRQNPDEFQLFKPYPNPFNPITAISYQLLAASQVNLTVYDIQGQEVALLVDEYKPAGQYEVTFDAKDLVSGVYFVRLEAGDFSQVQKVLLIK